jgi:hypothetical protein
VTDGDYKRQRGYLRRKIYEQFFWILIHVANYFFYVLPEINQPRNEMYLMQALWWALFCISHLLVIQTTLFACIFAYWNPIILLNENWQRHGVKL